MSGYTPTTEVPIIHIDEYTDLVDQAVGYIYRRYSEYVESDDLRQEAAVWWYGKGQRHLPAYLADDQLGRVRLSISRWLDSYARKEKAARSGYQPHDQYRYRPSEVADLIPVALDPDGLPAVGHHDGPAPHGNLAEGGDMLAALVDVRRGLEVLAEDDLHFLTLADDCNYDWERVATRLGNGVLADTHRRRHAKIAERIARWLSHEEDHQ